jgi:hypothetical protein
MGGIVGHVSGANNQIADSYSAGELRMSGTAANTSAAGGIIGYSGSRIDVINSYSSAGVSSLYFAGGLVGNSTATAVYVAGSAAVNDYIYGVTSARIGNNLHTNSRNNYAFGDIAGIANLVEGSLKDGTSISGIAVGRPEFFSDTIGFSLDVWDMDYLSRNYKLPILKGLGDEQKDFPNTNHYY